MATKPKKTADHDYKKAFGLGQRLLDEGRQIGLPEYRFTLDGRKFADQRQIVSDLLEIAKRDGSTRFHKSAIDELQGLENLLDAIADQAHDAHGINCLLSPNAKMPHGCRPAPLPKLPRKGKGFQCPECKGRNFEYLEDIACRRRVNGIIDGVLQIEGRYTTDGFDEDGENFRLMCSSCCTEFAMPGDLEHDFI